MDYWIRAFSCHNTLQCGWLLQLVLSLALLGLVYFILRKVCSRGMLFGFQLNLKKICLPPIRVILLVSALYCILFILAEEVGHREMLSRLKPYKDGIIIVSLAWMFYRMQRAFFVARVSEALALAFSKIFSVCLVLLTGGTLLRIFHLDVMPLLAFGGIGAAILGFAAKDVMGSVFGGMMLALTRPFSVHDQILIPEKEVEGTIEEMGWCFTILRDKDQRPMYLPNSLFSQCLVLNLSRRTGRRILEVFRLRYADLDKISVITKDIKEALLQDPLIDQKQPILVYTNAIGEYSLEMSLDVYTTVTSLKDFAVEKEVVLQTVLRALHHHGAHLAYPVTVYQEVFPGSVKTE